MIENKKTMDISELLLNKADKAKQEKILVLDMEEIEFEERTIEISDKPIKKGVVDIEDLLSKQVEEYTQDLSEEDFLLEEDVEGETVRKNKSIYSTTDINTLLKQKESSRPKSNPLTEQHLKKVDNSDEEETDLQIKNSPTHSLLDLDKQLKKQFFNEKSDVFDVLDEKSLRIIELLKQKKIIEAYQLMESMFSQYESRGSMQLIEYLFRHFVR